MNKTGGIIFALRKVNGWTQEQLAELVGVSSVAISKWERGVNMPDVELLCRLADLFQVSVDELLGRYNEQLAENAKYSKEQLADFEIGRKLSGYCELARKYGLLALEPAVKEDKADVFLEFAVVFLLDGIQKEIDMGLLFGWLDNYALKEEKQSRCRMICDTLKAIFSGENEELVKEIIASYLGRELRSKFVNASEKEEGRSEILSRYADRTCTEDLLEELADCEDKDIRALLMRLDNATLISALCGASGKVCVKFLQNVSGRLLFFLNEDIQQYCGTEEEKRNAQKRMLEMAVGMGMVGN